jgi:hypothetical protein
MANNNTFDACRSCKKTAEEAELIDLFAGNGENARKVEEITKINVRNSKTFVVDIKLSISPQIFADRNKHNAMMCKDCLEKVNKAFELVQMIRENEIYFLNLRGKRNLRSG